MATPETPSNEGPCFSSPFRRRFVEAADKNESILEFRADPKWAPIWKEENIAKSPPMRVEFEHAVVFGSLGEALSMRQGKSGWGNLLGIEPYVRMTSCIRRGLLPTESYQ